MYSTTHTTHSCAVRFVNINVNNIALSLVNEIVSSSEMVMSWTKILAHVLLREVRAITFEIALANRKSSNDLKVIDSCQNKMKDDIDSSLVIISKATG